MGIEFTLPLDDHRATLEVVGGKGASLAAMSRSGLPIPDGFHVTTAAYLRFVEENDLLEVIKQALGSLTDSDVETLDIASKPIRDVFVTAPIASEIENQIREAYMAMPGTAPSVAVRSSATAEDLPEASFAGQQETYLNVAGDEDLLDAVRGCWASLWAPRSIAYRARVGIPDDRVAMGVVVQRLFPADAAGVLFTANPVSGRRDQLVINASWGLGEAVVGGQVTPDTLTVDRESRRLISRETVRKEIRTVQVPGGTAERPVPANLRDRPVLSEQEARRLVDLGIRISELYGMPMDIEWAIAENEFAILQARPITALPIPEASVPTEWNLPAGAYTAMRNNIVELMADPLTPLFETLGLEAVNVTMRRIMSELLGRGDVLPGDPIIVVNHYAYYNGSLRFGQIVRLILGSRRILKQMFKGAVERWTDEGLPRYRRKVEDWDARDWRDLPNREILAVVRGLEEAAIEAYVALVSGVIPGAWMSEAWFTLVYRLFRRPDDPQAPVYLLGFESAPIRSEKSLYDLSSWARQHRGLAEFLTTNPSGQPVTRLADDEPPAGVEAESWHEWRLRWQAYLSEFGHMIYNLDFSNSVLLDDPGPAVDTLRMYMAGEGADPHARQAEAVARREAATGTMEERLGGLRRSLFRSSLQRAQRYAPLREDGLADVGLSYPLLRRMLLTLGHRLVEVGVIEAPADIFWLDSEDVESAADGLDRGEPAVEGMGEVIAHRKAEWLSARKATPPVMLPRLKIPDIRPVWLKSLIQKTRSGHTLKGVGASPGRVKGPAAVMHGPQDFGRMSRGDILVAPLTTPAWTPLFARAAGIVTDVGGPLSHGSIVAREYGIPAVLGTGKATAEISAGQTLVVDGSAGTVDIRRETAVSRPGSEAG